MMDDDLFLKEKPVRALLTIQSEDEPYASEISKSIDTTYAHTVKVVGQMQDQGLIKQVQTGRKKVIKPTREAEDLAKVLRKFCNLRGYRQVRARSFEQRF